jgi:hypothetical protein
MTRVVFGILLLVLAVPTHAFDHDYHRWDALLKVQVRDGLVTYAAIKAYPADLQAVLDEFSAVTPAMVADWTREQRLAFWINAYNSYTLKAIIDHYPLSRSGLKGLAFPRNSIRQIAGVWDKLTWKVAGEELTLDQIEHQKLRDELKEPRIHFALVCAARGCPKLRSEAYTAEKVQAQLTSAAQDFVNDPTRNRVDPVAKTAELSKIFEWFGGDFAGFKGVSGHEQMDGPLSFMSPLLPPEQAQALAAPQLKVSFMDYDWTLNERPVPLPASP